MELGTFVSFIMRGNALWLFKKYPPPFEICLILFCTAIKQYHGLRNLQYTEIYWFMVPEAR